MEREEKTQKILKQFKKKNKRIVNNNIFTDFFYVNKEREVIEFLKDENHDFLIESFFKEFLPQDFRDFVELKIFNEEEEEVKIWYYNEEDLALVIQVNWGFTKNEISIDIDSDNFMITNITNGGLIRRGLNANLLNDFFISFLSIQAKALSETFNKIKN